MKVKFGESTADAIERGILERVQNQERTFVPESKEQTAMRDAIQLRSKKVTDGIKKRNEIKKICTIKINKEIWEEFESLVATKNANNIMNKQERVGLWQELTEAIKMYIRKEKENG
jgi:hypothetical protein